MAWLEGAWKKNNWKIWGRRSDEKIHKQIHGHIGGHKRCKSLYLLMLKRSSVMNATLNSQILKLASPSPHPTSADTMITEQSVWWEWDDTGSKHWFPLIMTDSPWSLWCPTAWHASSRDLSEPMIWHSFWRRSASYLEPLNYIRFLALWSDRNLSSPKFVLFICVPPAYKISSGNYPRAHRRPNRTWSPT